MPYVTGAVSCNFVGHVASGQAFSNTFHLWDGTTSGDPPDLPALTTLASDLHTYFSTTYLAMLFTTSTWDSIKCSQISADPKTDPPLEAFLAVNAAGTRVTGSGTLPDSMCGVMSIKSPIASRRYRGHLMLPPAFNPADVNGDNFAVSQPYYVAMLALAAKFETGVLPTPTWTGTELAHYTLSLFSRTALTAAEPAMAFATAVVTQPKIHWLRSRERGTS